MLVVRFAINELPILWEKTWVAQSVIRSSTSEFGKLDSEKTDAWPRLELQDTMAASP
jgi:hypothetical protein